MMKRIWLYAKAFVLSFVWGCTLTLGSFAAILSIICGFLKFEDGKFHPGYRAGLIGGGVGLGYGVIATAGECASACFDAWIRAIKYSPDEDEIEPIEDREL